MKKLISSIDFGYLCRQKEKSFNTRLEYLNWYENTRNNYDEFLKQPLKLEMFIPCDEDGNVLKKPCGYNNFLEYGINDFLNIEECEEYKKAKEKVLFKGFEEKNGYASYTENWLDIDEDFCENKTIEDLVYFNIELTEEKAKELGL